MFWECNRKYFDHRLPTPKYGLLHSFRILARFEYDRRKGKADKRKRLLFSDYFDFDEETFRNIMVHEMIHYYLLLYGTNDKCDHGADFKAMVQEMNQKFGLNITTTFDASGIPNSPNAPKRTWWRCFHLWLGCLLYVYIQCLIRLYFVPLHRETFNNLYL